MVWVWTFCWAVYGLALGFSLLIVDYNNSIADTAILQTGTQQNNRKPIINNLFPKMQPSPSPNPSTNLLTTLYTRIHNYQASTKGELILIVSSFSAKNGERVQDVYRKLGEFENLASYVVGQYGGYIVPVPDRRVFRSGTSIELVMQLCEQYLQDLRTNCHTSPDNKLYCFLLEQPMQLPQQATYTKVLSNASNLSKKYLNTIFTRKQLPEEKGAVYLVDAFRGLGEKYRMFVGVGELVEGCVGEIGELEEIMGIFAELSGEMSSSILPQGDLIIQTTKILHTGQKYMQQANQAFERWQFLVQRVRQLQNNLYKGLHEDEQKYHSQSQQLKKWTASLNADMRSMGQCFDQFLDYLCHGVIRMKAGMFAAGNQEDMMRMMGIGQEREKEEEGLWVDKEAVSSDTTIDEAIQKV